MSDRVYTGGEIGKVVANALAAARASQQGETRITLGEGAAKQQLNLLVGGYCARFVRQVYETACGLRPGTWEFQASDAKAMTAKLASNGHRVMEGSLQPGDIVGIHLGSGQYGHVAIYVGKIGGKDTIAENTSSKARGNPQRAGTKLTPYSDISHRVTGVYRLVKGTRPAKWPSFRSFMLVGREWKEIELVPGGDHRLDSGKVFWKLKDE